MATHHFLSRDDLEAISKEVEAYCRAASFDVVVDETDRPVAFMGMTGAKIDSLFVHPDYFGRGLGRLLIDAAKKRFSSLAVDVNEANGSARDFYLKMGFVVAGRSETDDQGRPFPLLHLSLPDPSSAG